MVRVSIQLKLALGLSVLILMALNLPDDIGEGKALILFLTYVIVLFTILVQGLTLKNIVK